MNSSATIEKDVDYVVTPAPGQRVFYVDVIRCYASFLVVSSHVFAPICSAMTTTPSSVWSVFNVLDSLIRPAVALFIMISGKLLLGSSREEPYFQSVRRRYVRLLLPFFTWSMIYELYENYDGESFSLGASALVHFLKGPTEYHLWFMYIILGFYLMAPFIRRFLHLARKDEIQAVLILWGIFITVRTFAPDYAPSGTGTGMLDYGGYFILGYVLDRSTLFRDKKVVLAACVLAIIGFNAVGTYLLTIRNGGVLDETLYWGAAPLVALQAAGTFLLLKQVDYAALFARHSWLHTLVHAWSRESYNIYLIHAFIIAVLAKGYLGVTLSETTGGSAFIGVPFTTITVIGISFLLAWVLQRIPLISRVFVMPSRPL